MKKLNIGFVADPIANFDAQAETTFFLLREAAGRGHKTWVMELKDLFLNLDGVSATARQVIVSQKNKNFKYRIVDEKEIRLANLDAVFLRKDPPVDLQYIDHLTLLELVERPRPILRQAQDVQSRGLDIQKRGHGELVEPCRPVPLFINSPSGIKKANEKIYPLCFPGLSPPSLVAMEREKLLSFISKHQKTVVKPLNQSGGRGIFIAEKSMPDLPDLLQKATLNFTRYILVQKFIPEAAKGDKRILLLDGKPLGAFLRIPAPGNFLGNLHQGATWVKGVVTPHETGVLKKLETSLKQEGLHLVGVDFIGNFVTEINTTSPMGIREINHLDNSQIEKTCINWLESQLNPL